MAITDRSSLFNRIGIIIFHPIRPVTKHKECKAAWDRYRIAKGLQKGLARNESESLCRPTGQNGLRAFCGREVDQREDEDCRVGEAALDPFVHVSLQR